MPLVALLAVAVAVAPATARYDFLSGGKVAGSLVRTRQPGGAVRVEFGYVENGRGPKLVETIRLDPAGQVVTHEVTGTNTFGSKVDERFARQGRTATWKTTADEGSSEVDGEAVYLPLVPTPESTATIVRAALAGRGRVKLLPAGEIRVERVRTLQVRGGAGPRAVSLYSVTGVDFAPQYLWAPGAMVMKQGDVFFPAEIYRAIGITPFVEPPAIRPPLSPAKTAAAVGR